MFGFVIGTACLLGLIATLRRGRWACGGGGYGMHRGPWGRRYGRFGGFGGFRGGRRFFLSFLYEQLGTTPSQEKVIAAAIDELREAAFAHRSEARATRVDVAAAVRSPSFDETRLGELFARHDTAIEALRKAGVGAVGKIHAVLDDRQRERLADIIEAGPAAVRWQWGEGGACGGPYRDDRDDRRSGAWA